MQNYEQLIRERAYDLWEQEGRPNDRADVHWCIAAEQVLSQNVDLRTSKAKRSRKVKISSQETRLSRGHSVRM
jgi:hypothetical protein